MKPLFKGLDRLCPLDGAPERKDYKTTQDLLDATLCFISKRFRSMNVSEKLYRCRKCLDEKVIFWTEEHNGFPYEYSKRCDCEKRGSWASDSHGFPEHVKRIPLLNLNAPECVNIVNAIKNRSRLCVYFGAEPNKVYQAGLSMASELSKNGIKLRVLSVSDAPKEFGKPWNPQVSGVDVVFIRDVDRRLNHAQVQALSTLLGRIDCRAIVVLGEPIKKLPKNDSWAGFGLALQSREAHAKSIF